jgi:hypothetical protein
VEAQRFNLDMGQKLKREELSANQSLLALMRQKFGDDKSAVLATKASMLAMAEDKFNADITKKGGFSDMSTKATALQALSQLQSQRQTYESQLRASQQEQFNLKEMLAGADKYNLTTEQAQALYNKDSEKYVQGFGLALSKEDKSKFQESYLDSKASLAGLDDILSKGIDKLNPIERAKVGSEIALLVGRMRLAVLGPGPMTPEEYQRLLDTIGNPLQIMSFPGTQIEKLKTVRARLQEQQDAQVKQYFGKQTFEDLKQRKGTINFK